MQLLGHLRLEFDSILQLIDLVALALGLFLWGTLDFLEAVESHKVEVTLVLEHEAEGFRRSNVDFLERKMRILDDEHVDVEELRKRYDLRVVAPRG